MWISRPNLFCGFINQNQAKILENAIRTLESDILSRMEEIAGVSGAISSLPFNDDTPNYASSPSFKGTRMASRKLSNCLLESLTLISAKITAVSYNACLTQIESASPSK